MSLINDMLRDLERRERNERPQGQRMPHAADPVPVPKRIRHFHILVMASVAVLLGLGALVQFERKNEFAVGRQSVDNPVSSAPEVAQSEPAQSLPDLAKAAPFGLKEKTKIGRALAESNDQAPAMAQEKSAPVENAMPGLEASVRQVSLPAVVADTAVKNATVSQKAEAVEPEKPKAVNVDWEADQAEEPSRGKTRRVLSFEERDRETSGAGSALARRGQLLEAYDLLLAYVDEHPEAHRSRATLATILIAQQEFPQAASLLRQGLDLAPNYADYKKLQARLLIRHGKAEEALHLLSEFPPRLEQDIEYHDLLATLHQQADQHEKALVVYQGLLSSKPGEGRWWAAKAISHEALGQRQEALASYRQASQSKALAPALRRYSNKRLQVLSR